MHKGNEKRRQNIINLVEMGGTYGEVAKVMKVTRCAVAGVMYRKRKADEIKELRQKLEERV